MKKSVLIILSIILCTQLQAQHIYPNATSIVPLKINEKSPNFSLLNEKGETIDFQKLNSKKPIVLIFYRAGWCPFCNVHLAEIQSKEDSILNLGYQIVAISTDKPEKLQETINKNHLKYTLLSDAECKVASMFGIAFKAGENWTLPVPALFVIDKNGIIKFIHSNPDYKQRISSKSLLRELKI